MLETLETLYRVSFSPSSMVGSMAGLPKVNSSMAGWVRCQGRETIADICLKLCQVVL